MLINQGRYFTLAYNGILIIQTGIPKKFSNCNFHIGRLDYSKQHVYSGISKTVQNKWATYGQRIRETFQSWCTLRVTTDLVFQLLPENDSNVAPRVCAM